MGNENTEVCISNKHIVYREILEIEPTQTYFLINRPISFNIVLHPTTQLILQDVGIKLRMSEVSLTKSSDSIIQRVDNSVYIYQSVLNLGKKLNVPTTLLSLSPGTYKFPYSIQIPQNFPSSFEAPYKNRIGYIRYYLETNLISPYSQIKKENLMKILNCNVNLPRMVSNFNQANLNIKLFVKKGTGKLSASLPVDIYEINSTISANVTLDNTESQIDATQIKLSIYKRIVFYDRQNKEIFNNDKKINEKIFNEKVEKNTKRDFNFSITLIDTNLKEYTYDKGMIPYPEVKDFNLLMPTIDSKLIKCNYFFRVTAYYENFLTYNSRPRVEIPIYVVQKLNEPFNNTGVQPNFVPVSYPQQSIQQPNQQPTQQPQQMSMQPPMGYNQPQYPPQQQMAPNNQMMYNNMPPMNNNMAPPLVNSMAPPLPNLEESAQYPSFDQVNSQPPLDDAPPLPYPEYNDVSQPNNYPNISNIPPSNSFTPTNQ